MTAWWRRVSTAARLIPIATGVAVALWSPIGSAEDLAAARKFTLCKTWNFNSTAIASGINDYGVIVGSVVGPVGTGTAGPLVKQGFALFPDGTEKVFDIPLPGGGGSSATGANGINDNNQVVGALAAAGTGSAQAQGLAAFLGTISPAGFTLSQIWKFGEGGGANGTNNAGQVVGEFQGMVRNLKGTHGYVLFPPVPNGLRKNFDIKKYHVIGTAGSFGGLVPRTATNANGINDRGRVVGDYLIAIRSPVHVTGSTIFERKGFLGTVTKSGFAPSSTWTLGQDHVEANGINNAGQIVGSFVGRLRKVPGTHGYVQSGSNRQFFDVAAGAPGSSGVSAITHANGINNCGQIVGDYLPRNSGMLSAFLGTVGPGSCTPGCVGVLARVAVKPASLNFGRVAQSTTSPPKMVTITNVKTTAPLTVTLLAPQVSAGFVISGNDCPATLTPGNSCHLMVKFSPANTGIVKGQLTVNDDAFKHPHRVSLSGRGT